MPVPMAITYRMIIFPEDEVSGNVIAETIRQKIEEELDADEGDSVDMTLALSMDISQQTPVELIDLLHKARNALIRTKVSSCWDTARELDKIAHGLLFRSLNSSDQLATYDWGTFLEVAKEVLDGKSPVGH